MPDLQKAGGPRRRAAHCQPRESVLRAVRATHGRLVPRRHGLLPRVRIGSELHDPRVADVRHESHGQGDGDLRWTPSREGLHPALRETRHRRGDQRGWHAGICYVGRAVLRVGPDARSGGLMATRRSRRATFAAAVAIVVAVALGVVGAAPAVRTDARPNVVIVLVDDMGWSDIGDAGWRDPHAQPRRPRPPRRQVYAVLCHAPLLADTLEPPDGPVPASGGHGPPR